MFISSVLWSEYLFIVRIHRNQSFRKRLGVFADKELFGENREHTIVLAKHIVSNLSFTSNRFLFHAQKRIDIIHGHLNILNNLNFSKPILIKTIIPTTTATTTLTNILQLTLVLLKEINK